MVCMRKAGNNRTARTNPQRVTAVPTTWEQFAEDKATSGSGLWKAWDGATAELNRLWPTIPAARFQEDDTAFGQWKMPIGELLLYIRDNELAMGSGRDSRVRKPGAETAGRTDRERPDRRSFPSCC
jgi:hypothetical protein